jgi:hypothetical protein
MMRAILVSGLLAFLASGLASTEEREAFLSWSDKQAAQIGKAMRANGRVGGWLDTRVVHTEHSYNYKLRGTWLTPEVIRASARMHQLEEGLDDDETLELVKEAETLGDTVILVEIDPREGSGIIPRDWVALLRPKSDDGAGLALRGVNQAELRAVKALSGTEQRDYAYDVFWLVFPLVTSKGELLFGDGDEEAELAVRIGGKEGRVSWLIPRSIRDRAREIQSRSGDP